MRKGFLGSLAVLAAGSGLTFGQSAPSPAGPPMSMPVSRPGPGLSTLPAPGPTLGPGAPRPAPVPRQNAPYPIMAGPGNAGPNAAPGPQPAVLRAGENIAIGQGCRLLQVVEADFTIPAAAF